MSKKITRESSSQFARLEAHALVATKSRPKNPPEGWKAKSTVDGVCGEAARLETHSKHLEQAPDFDLVYGMSPLDLAARLKSRAEEIKQEGGRFKSDQCVMVEGVLSYPKTTCDENFFLWLDDSIAFLKEKYGDKLKSVVVHYDEAHPHAHFFTADFKTLSVNELDPARIARRAEEEKKKQAGKDENGKWIYAPKMQAQKEALSAWLDDYHQKVSMKYEHNRDIGARKARYYGTPRQVKMTLDLDQKQKTLAEKEEDLKQKRDQLMNLGKKLVEEKTRLEAEKTAVAEKSVTFDLLIEQLQAEVERLKSIGDMKTAAMVSNRIAEMRQKATSSIASAFKPH